ncbi:MAG TPA: sortase [Amycolatopsis sp.]|nr:sortase [Amycolatopsis sp.]
MTAISSQADVVVTKVASSGTVVTGSNVTFTVTAHNGGPSVATGVQVTDVLPAGLTLVSATPATGTYTSGTGVWDIGSLASGASTTLTVVATVTTTGPVTNTARKTAENELDPNPGNDVSSAAITGTGLPGPPNGGMAGFQPSPVGTAPGGGLLIAAGLAGFFGLLFLRRRSHRLAVAAGLMAFTTLITLAPPAPAFSSASGPAHLSIRPSDLELFGKPISTVKPELGSLATTFQPARSPITPYRIRIPALSIDTMVESVGTTASGLMDVPSNLWDTAWLQTGVKPGASGQAVIDGHLDSVRGSAIFGKLDRLRPGDQILVSDAEGRELTFKVTALQVVPLDGFPTLRVFGPAHGRFLNLITCAGRFDPARRTYDHRLVVFTELAVTL